VADIPFAVDISQPEPSTGGNIMWHVRAANADEFIRRIQDLQTRVPGLAPFVVITGAAAKAALTGPPAEARATGELAARRAAQPAPATAVATTDVIPVCDVHQKSRWSAAFHGLYCPKKRNDGSDKWCPWKHECGAACAHPAETAAA